MKLFGDFEAVKFIEENLIFVTHNKYLYYIYNSHYKHWNKHINAGNDLINVSSYEDVSKDELVDAMGGKFPQKETDFMRLCNTDQLSAYNMLNLLEEDYPEYMAESAVYRTIQKFLIDSAIPHKAYSELRKLLNKAVSADTDKTELLSQIKKLSFSVIGRDIYKKEIGIVDGHDTSSCFWIMPVRIIDFSDTNNIDSVAEMSAIEISIEENDVYEFLTPFLYKYFAEELKANKRRKNIEGFEWNTIHNFFTYESIEHILNDIRETVDALSAGRDNEYTAKLKEKRYMTAYDLFYNVNRNTDKTAEHGENRPTSDSTDLELIIDFYRRFLYRMEYMMKVGKEKGYNLISFMGP